MGVSVREKITGSNEYWVFVRHESLPNGRWSRKIEGTKKFSSKQLAFTLAEKLKAKIALLKPGERLFDEKVQTPTLSQYFEKFERGHMKTVKPKTAEGYKGAFNRYIKQVFGSVPVSEITRAKVKTFVDQLKTTKWKDKDGKNKPLARDTVRLIVSTLRKVLAECVDDEIIAANPASRLGTRYRELPRVHDILPFSEQEIVQFMEAAQKKRPYWLPYFACLFYAGLRPGEGIALKWNDVDFDKRVLHVRATGSGKSIGTPKTESSKRAVEMPDSLHSILKDLFLQRQKEWDVIPEFVFCTSTGTMTDMHNIRFQHFQPLLKELKLEPRGLHQFRHSFASQHLQAGTPIEWVSRQLGHSDVTTTYKHYYSYLPERQKVKYTGALPAIGIKSTDNVVLLKR